MKSYLMWSGGLIAILTTLLILVSGSFTDYSKCEPIMDEIISPTGDPVPMIHLKENCAKSLVEGQTVFSLERCAQTYVEQCASLRNNIYISYIVIIVGIALLTGGFLTQRGDKSV